MVLLDLLPAEIRLEICFYLSPCDLKAVRYVNREMLASATPALFRCAVVGARYHALHAFQKIAECPALSKYVREIAFDGSVYDQGLAKHQGLYRSVSSGSAATKAESSWISFARLGLLLGFL